MPVPGFDVSRAQRGLNMKKAWENGKVFVIPRITTGDEQDPVWTCHFTNARHLLYRGLYHALQPNVPHQAMTFVGALYSNGAINEMELPPVVDVEKAGLDEDQVLAFVTDYEKLCAAPLMIYTSIGRWHSIVGHNRKWALKYMLWVAHWYVTDPMLPTPWTEYVLHQTGVFEVPFWNKPIDLNVFPGTREELHQFSWEWRKNEHQVLPKRKESRRAEIPRSRWEWLRSIQKSRGR